MKSLAVFSLVSFFGALMHLAASQVIPTKAILDQYDFNQNGQLEQVEVFAALAVKFGIAPINVDGLKERAQALKAKGGGGNLTIDDLNLTHLQANKLAPLYLDFQNEYRDKESKAQPAPSGNADVFNPAYLNPSDLGIQAPPYKGKIGENYVFNNPKIKVRSNTDQLKYSEISDAQPGLFSFARDFDSQKSSFGLQGAIAVDVQVTRSPTAPELSKQTLALLSYDFLPSATFNRLPSSSADNATMNFRLGNQAVFSNQNWLGKILDGEILGAGLSFTTDFEGRQKLLGGDLDLTFYRSDIALGAFNGIGLPMYPDGNPIFKILINAVLHMEGGATLDAGTNINLHDGEGYYRIGPLIGIRIVPIKVPELALNVQYTYFPTLWGGGPASSLFDTSLEWDIGGTGHYSLKIEYQNGRLPLTLQPVNALTAGLGVKY